MRKEDQETAVREYVTGAIAGSQADRNGALRDIDDLTVATALIVEGLGRLAEMKGVSMMERSKTALAAFIPGHLAIVSGDTENTTVADMTAQIRIILGTIMGSVAMLRTKEIGDKTAAIQSISAGLTGSLSAIARVCVGMGIGHEAVHAIANNMGPSFTALYNSTKDSANETPN